MRAIKPTLLVVAGGVALLLLVACANASTLFLARAANRRHELAVRAALGATRSRLFSLAVCERLLLAVLGGLVGLALGSWTLRALLPLFAGALPSSLSIDVDARTALFTAAISALLGLVFGGVVVAQRPGPLVDMLKASARTTGGAAATRMRSALVVTQVALAVVLLSAAGLMLNSVAKLSRVSTGFNADSVLSTFRWRSPGSNYAAPASRIAFASVLLERLAANPGVRRADLVSAIPFACVAPTGSTSRGVPASPESS